MNYFPRVKRISLFFLAAFTFICILVMLWLPYRFNIPAWSDDWIWINRAAQYGLNFANDPRPFAQVPSYLGYALTPNSFLGTNVVLALLFLIKTLGMYTLLRQIFKDNPAFAFVGGALVALFPGDIANFEMMTLYIHLTIDVVLIALNFLIILWKLSGQNGLPTRKNTFRWGVTYLGMCLAISLIYEVIFPIVFLSPIILIWLEKRFNRKVIVLSAFWYVTPSILVIRIIFLAISIPNFLSYQTAAIAQNNDLGSILRTLWTIYSRMFWSSWAYSITIAPQGLSNPLTYISFATFLASFVVIWLHQRSANLKPQWKRTFLILVTGIVIFFLGFLLYIPSVFRDSDFRTLLVSFLGAAITGIAVIWIFANLPFIARAVISLCLLILGVALFLATDRFTSLIVISLAIGFLLEKRTRFAVMGASVISLAAANSVGLLNYMASRENYIFQHQILQSITDQAPHFSANTVILLTAPRGHNKPFRMLDQWRYDVLTAMLQYVYQDKSIYGFPCDTYDGKSGWYGADCHLKKDFAEIDTGSMLGVLQIPYDRIAIFDYQEGQGYRLLQTVPVDYLSEGNVIGYLPTNRIDYTAPKSDRVQTIYRGNNFAVARSK